MKRMIYMMLSILITAMLGITVSSCLLNGTAEYAIDGDDDSGIISNSDLVGTWAYKETGTGYSDERTYTFYSNGKGHFKEVWVNNGNNDLAASYTEENDFSYVAAGGVLIIDGYDHKYSVSGNTLTLDGQKYTKQ